MRHLWQAGRQTRPGRPAGASAIEYGFKNGPRPARRPGSTVTAQTRTTTAAATVDAPPAMQIVLPARFTSSAGGYWTSIHVTVVGGPVRGDAGKKFFGKNQRNSKAIRMFIDNCESDLTTNYFFVRARAHSLSSYAPLQILPTLTDPPRPLVRSKHKHTTKRRYAHRSVLLRRRVSR